MSNRLQYIIVSTFLVAAASNTVSAQDFGSLVQGISKIVPLPANSGNLISVIQSISEVSTGTIDPGAQLPQDANGKVLLYRTAHCPYCIQAAAYMRQQQIPFLERDVERNRTYSAEMTRFGSKGVPFMVMGDKTLVGFSESSFKKTYAQFQHSQPSALGAPAYPPGSAIPADSYQASLTRPVGVAPPSNMQSGDPFVSKIAGVPVYQKPSKSGVRVMTLVRSEEVVFMGEERNGMMRITSGKGEGWVDQLLMKRQ